MLKKLGIYHVAFATDINHYANLATLRTSSINNVEVEVVNCDFAISLAGLLGQVDILIFNPPYVPTPDDEIQGTGIEVAWAGGGNGRVVIDRFLPHVKELLSKTGVCYMVLVQDNKPNDLKQILKRVYNISMEVIHRTKAKNEMLMIVKLCHTVATIL